MPKTNNKVDIDPEDIFRKSEDEMSDIEKMMADILNDYKEDTKNIPSKQSPSEEPEQVYVSPAPPVRKKRTPDTAPQASASDTAPSARSTSRSSSRAAKRAPVQDAPASSAVETRSRKKEREKNIEQAAKKRSAAPLIAAFVIIAILVVGALVYTKMFEDLRTQRIAAQSASATPAPAAQSGSADDAAASDHTEATPEVTFPPDMIFPTPEPDDVLASGDVRIQPPAGSIVLMSDTVPTPAPAGEASSADAASETDASSSSAAASESAAQPAEHTYQFFREDKSWTEAQQACRDKGGYLAVVTSEEELNKIIDLALANGVEKVWLGCHRENGQLVWENNETVTFYAWGPGEPSQFDAGDNVSEDYLLLWRLNGAWVYNDSRNDPVHDYPGMYSGQIGYVCEFD